MKRVFLLMIIFGALGFTDGVRVKMAAHSQSKIAAFVVSQITDAAFVGGSTAWFISIDGEMLHTSDGGISWDRYSENRIWGAIKITFVDQNQGWGINEREEILHTSDAGKTWKVLTKVVPKGWEPPQSDPDMIRFFDEKHGWLVEATHFIWRTDDGGYHWQSCYIDLDPDHLDVRPDDNTFFVNAVTGWAGSEESTLFRATDGGLHWTRKQLDFPRNTIENLFLVDESHGWITLGWDRLYYTDDGGDTWHSLPEVLPQSGIKIDSIDFLNRNEGWISGAACTKPDRFPCSEEMDGVILHTRDGGQSWERVQISKEVEQNFVRIFFPDSNHGWVYSRDNIYHTTDAGKTWSKRYGFPEIKR